MLFLTEILLLAVVLCVCWETGDTRCGVECDESQRGLALPTCYLRDDGTSTFCGITLRNTDTEIRTLGSFDKLTLMLELQTLVNKLNIYNGGIQLKVNTFRFYREITYLELYYASLQINPGMFSLLPNLKNLAVISVLFEYFPYFGYFNRFLTHLSISEFDIPSTTPRILVGGHVSGLTGLKHLYLSPNRYMNTTDQSFAGLTALTYLYLQRFHIPNPVTTLSPLVRLRELRLYGCRLTEISFLARAPSLYGLTHLTLKYNLITRIQPGIFSGYTNLVHLLLYSNSLAQLECGAFTGLSNLKNLDLGSNPIQDICFTAFKGLESLIELFLDSTSPTSLSSRMFEYLPSLRYIWLFSTPLHCDCSLQWLSRVQHNFGLTIDSNFSLLGYNFSLYDASCASPSEHINKSATDLSIYRDCTRDLSYHCFNRSISCPSGTCCQDTLDTYLCVCQQVGDLFVRSLNRCVSSEEISNGLLRLDAITPTYATCPTATCPSCPTATCPSCPTATCPTCPTATCPSCPRCPITAGYTVTRSLPSKSPPNRP